MTTCWHASCYREECHHNAVNRENDRRRRAMDLTTAAGNALIEMRNTHKDLDCPCRHPEDVETCPLWRAIEDLAEALDE
jgi:hypothetical protein